MEGKNEVVIVPVTEHKLIEWMEAYGVGKQLQPNEKKQFIEIAMAYQLNPFKREIYCTAYGEGQYRSLSIITGYEVYLKRAERTGDLAGWGCRTEGSVKTNDLRAIITIHRKSWTTPLIHEVEYTEYVQTKKDGTPTKFWANKAKTMIKKVAMAQGFRLAFPDELGGMPYTSDELPPEMGAETAEYIKGKPEAEPGKHPEKAEPEMTVEQAEAKRQAAAAQYTKDHPQGTPAKPQAAPAGDKQEAKTAIGHIEKRNEANKGGYVTYELENYQTEDGRFNLRFATKDTTIIETLDSRHEAGEKVSFEYVTKPYKTAAGKSGLNYEIVQVVSIQEPAAAQPGD